MSFTKTLDDAELTFKASRFAQDAISHIAVHELEPIGGIERVSVEWVDGDQKQQRAVRLGTKAREIITDLQAMTCMGAPMWRIYLVARIRGFNDSQGGD